ncbi:hypothetical protein GCM10010329_79340 [Streptomyces spiroverticillatus]|uniref:Sortase n=1 Tax=Streptomyces finlayi TaxID=67296 RepID=A0A919CFJ2_9ACTN|nr:class F sortase [Streptomyces finlayi]GHA44778.1 hypothetical protein GCM10010329_79340 [Streptomyces spiroverticillatus]GHD17988.1 hypothetical protein GCM10010334_80320 [Streptomyces finlayi]
MHTVAAAVFAVSGTAVLTCTATGQEPRLPVPAADFGPPASAGPAPSARPVRAAEAVAVPPPVAVTVPRAGLNAPVTPVGVRKDGSADVPANPAFAGWYRHGPAPGAPRGSATLMGHVDSRTGGLGEFARLADVALGDRAVVRRAGAPPVTYRIVRRVTVDRDRLPASAFARGGPPVLTLITCAPPYRPESGGYRRNLVVTAVPDPG